MFLVRMSQSSLPLLSRVPFPFLLKRGFLPLLDGSGFIFIFILFMSILYFEEEDCFSALFFFSF